MTRHLAPRLIFLLAIALVLVKGVAGYFGYRIEERERTQEAVRSAAQVSRSLISATWHAMLADHREYAYDVMGTMGAKEGLDRVRLINGAGQITFATDPGAPAEVDRTTEPWRELLGGAKGAAIQPRSRILRGADGNRKVELTSPILNEPSCRTAACHAHPEEGKLLGAIDLLVDMGPVDEQLNGIRWRTLWTALAQTLVLGLIVIFFTRALIGRPIARLIAGTKAISAGDLDLPLQAGSATEIDELATAFDTMRQNLRKARATIEEFTQGLEAKVEERTRQLEQAREKLIQTDRIASLGQLAASVAHEVNNPIGSVVNLSMLLQRIMGEGAIPPGREAEFRRHLQRITEETQRVGRIVADLLAFSRRSSPARAPADLNEVVERTLGLLQHKLELAKVTARLERDRAMPRVPCDSSQIQQVVINLVMNAAEAMPQGGEVVVRTRTEPAGGCAILEVQDRGTGIPEEIRHKIFDPFFTTKSAGKGVGLGLAVVYGIVDSHGGSIDVHSREGQGSTFTVKLPLDPSGPGAVK